MRKLLKSNPLFKSLGMDSIDKNIRGFIEQNQEALGLCTSQATSTETLIHIANVQVDYAVVFQFISFKFQHDLMIL